MSNVWYWVCMPFAALLRLFYSLTSSYGVSLILFTLVVKLVLLPFQMKSKKSMVRMTRLNGKIQEIQKKYANNPTKMNEEIQNLYLEQGVNPMSGCLWSMLPLFFMIALYYAIREPIVYFMNFGSLSAGQEVLAAAKELIEKAGITLSSSSAYEQVEISNIINSQFPEFISEHAGWVAVDYHFLGLDLSAVPSSIVSTLSSGITWGAAGLFLIPFISAGLQFFTMFVTTKMQPSAGSAAQSNKMMMLTMPLFSLWLCFTVPAALGVYWIVQSVLSLVQEVVLNRFYMGKLDTEEEERQQKIDEDRKRRQERAKLNQEEQKKAVSLKKKQQQSKAKKKVTTSEAGRVGSRPYARGRAYKADRYNELE